MYTHKHGSLGAQMVLDRITGVVYAAIVGGFTMCGRIKSFLFKGGRFKQFRSFF